MNKIKKILIAEDELLVAKVMALMMEREGYKVKHMVDGLMVTSVVLAFEPDLIILDVFLKNKSSGIKAGLNLRENGILTPIIFTTGNSMDQTLADINGIPNTHLFIKPVDVGQLIKFIKEDF